MPITVATIDVGGTGADTAANARLNLGAAPSIAYDQANNAYGQANSAFNQANTALNTANSAGLPTLNIVSGTTVTAVKSNHYILTNASLTTITLPATPSPGDPVWITVGNNRVDNNVARNGSNINGLAEDMTINMSTAGIQLRYVNVTRGWVFS